MRMNGMCYIFLVIVAAVVVVVVVVVEHCAVSAFQLSLHHLSTSTAISVTVVR